MNESLNRGSILSVDSADRDFMNRPNVQPNGPKWAERRLGRSILLSLKMTENRVFGFRSLGKLPNWRHRERGSWFGVYHADDADTDPIVPTLP